MTQEYVAAGGHRPQSRGRAAKKIKIACQQQRPHTWSDLATTTASFAQVVRASPLIAQTRAMQRSLQVDMRMRAHPHMHNCGGAVDMSTSARGMPNAATTQPTEPNGGKAKASLRGSLARTNKNKAPARPLGRNRSRPCAPHTEVTAPHDRAPPARISVPPALAPSFSPDSLVGTGYRYPEQGGLSQGKYINKKVQK